VNRDKANAAVTWNSRKLSTTVYGDCYGTSRGLVVSFKQPPFDPTDTGIDDQPYNSANYDLEGT
jgi:hypothetical protein